MVLHVKIAVAKKFESNKMHLRDNQQKSNWQKVEYHVFIFTIE